MLTSEILTLARFKANERIASTNISDAHVLSLINGRYMRGVSTIMEVNRDYYGRIDSSTAFVNGTASYALPDLDSASRTRVMSIDRIEFAFSANNYIQALPITLLQLPDSNVAALTYSTQNPRYYLFGASLYVLPTPTANVSAAIKYWYQRRPLRITATTETPDIPDEIHEIIAAGAAMDIISAIIDPGYSVNVSDLEQQWKDGLSALVKAVSPRDDGAMPTIQDRTGYSTFLQEDYVEPGSVTVV